MREHTASLVIPNLVRISTSSYIRDGTMNILLYTRHLDGAPNLLYRSEHGWGGPNLGYRIDAIRRDSGTTNDFYLYGRPMQGTTELDYNTGLYRGLIIRYKHNGVLTADC